MPLHLLDRTKCPAGIKLFTFFSWFESHYFSRYWWFKYSVSHLSLGYFFFFFLKSSLAPNKTKDHSFFHLPHPISSYHKLLQCGALIQLNPWNDHCPKSLGGLWYAICLPLSDIRTHVCPWMRRDGRRLNWSMYHKEKISTGWICQGM